MWIRRHDGSLVNIEKYHKIDSAKTNNGYEVRAWYDDSRSILATYEKEQQAEVNRLQCLINKQREDNNIQIKNIEFNHKNEIIKQFRMKYKTPEEYLDDTISNLLDIYNGDFEATYFKLYFS